jgi:hypothetical protein
MISTIGAYVLAVGILATAWNLIRSRARGVTAGDDPWGAASLEWLASSPPAPYNFAHLPIVHSASPLWENGYTPGPAYDTARLTPRTSTLDGTLQAEVVLPAENAWSVIIAVAMLLAFGALLLRSYALMAAGLLFTLVSLAGWMWPPRRAAEVEA